MSNLLFLIIEETLKATSKKLKEIAKEYKAVFITLKPKKIQLHHH